MLTCPMLILTLYCNLGITRFGKENKKGTESNINYSALEQYRNIMTILTANPRYIIIIQIDKIMEAEEGTSTSCRSIIDEARASNDLIRCRERKRMIPNDQRAECGPPDRRTHLSDFTL